MVSYLYQSPSGVPGDVTRVDESNIEPVTLVAPFPTNYGLPMKYAAGANGAPEGVTPFVVNDEAALFCGILTRQAPAISGSSVNEDFFVDQPNSAQIQGLCVRGYVSVFVARSGDVAPVRGAPVYVIQTASGPNAGLNGQLSANPTDAEALTGTIVGNVTWAADGVDTNGFGEIRIAQ